MSSHIYIYNIKINVKISHQIYWNYIVTSKADVTNTSMKQQQQQYLQVSRHILVVGIFAWIRYQFWLAHPTSWVMGVVITSKSFRIQRIYMNLFHLAWLRIPFSAMHHIICLRLWNVWHWKNRSIWAVRPRNAGRSAIKISAHTSALGCRAFKGRQKTDVFRAVEGNLFLWPSKFELPLNISDKFYCVAFINHLVIFMRLILI